MTSRRQKPGESQQVSDRKSSDQRLQEYEKALEGSDDMIAVIDRDYRYLHANRALGKQSGSERGGLVGRTVAEVVGVEFFETVVKSKLEECFQGQVVRYEMKAQDPELGERDVLVSYHPMEGSQGVERTVCVMQDITERKQAEAEKTRLVAAIEQSAETVMITDTAGKIEYVNPAFTRTTGYSREEVLGQTPRILKTPSQDPAVYQQLWETILKGKVWHGELVNRRKDGEIFTAEMHIAPVRGADGELTHFIATKQDVTERKHLEEQFRQVQKMEAVGRLAGGVAHDFNNLLTIISGYTEMVLDGLDPGNPLQEHLAEIKKAGDRATSLTRQMLAFSRKQELASRVLDLNVLVADAEKMLRRLIGEDIEFVVVGDSALGQVSADPGQIDQILVNLAINARDAMPQGGKLIIQTANVELNEPYVRNHAVVSPGRYVMLAVSDTGIGMNADTQAHIFEPFFTTKEPGKGTGLGLAMVYGTVKQSGGYIWVNSEPGRGTTFKICLPRVDGADESVETTKA